MIKSLILASMLVGGAAHAKVSVGVGVGVGVKPAKNYTAFYAKQCVKSAKQAVKYNGGKVTYTQVVYASGAYSSVYVEYIDTNCYGPVCYKQKKNYTFDCVNGQY